MVLDPATGAIMAAWDGKIKKLLLSGREGSGLSQGFAGNSLCRNTGTCPEFHLLGLWDNLFLGHSDKSVLSLRMAVNDEETFF